MPGCDIPSNLSLADPLITLASKDFSEPLSGALYGPCDCEVKGDDTKGTERICGTGSDQNLDLVGYQIDTSSIYYI